ncbi:type I 3-dehydroquinase-domain-containing protein [Whalleya microplaca]|nr:type I 3-dehydroquinase-domain-containing protein [Whalleya microplaca]
MVNIKLDSGPEEAVVPATNANRRIFPTDASIILVGSRGAGKRTLGFIAAKHLGRRLITEDHSFEQSTGCNRATYLQKYGLDTFNQQMAMVLAQMLELNPVNCIIECGTGTLSHAIQDILETYVETNPIIYIHRDKEDLYKLLKLPVTDAERLLVADQRHREFSNLEYFNLYDASGEGKVTEEFALRSAFTSSARLIEAKQDFKNFLDHILGHGLTRSFMENPFSIKAIPPEYRTYTFVLHLRLSTLINIDIDLVTIEASGEAVELIIDTWPSNVLDLIATQVALIRRKLDVPIIYNVEENPREEHRRSQEEKDTVDLQLMLHGLQLGVDYLSLDLERNQELVSQVLTMRGRTKIIGNYVIRGFGAPQWTDDIYVRRYLFAQKSGCHIVRIARFCATDRSDERRSWFIERINALPDPKPQIVAYEFSVFGVVSTVQGHNLSPVGHDSLEKSAREQLVGVSTTRGVLRAIFRKGLLQPLNFYVLGSNVYYSASPSMHRAAYEHYMMPHTFDAKRCASMEEVDRIRSEHGFGGASLTAPFKVAIMSRLDHLSAHAVAIGAVNTLLPLRGETSSILDHANARNKAGSANKFYGDNTDWSAIVTCLRRAISPRNSVQPSRTTGLVIGAGGMARAAIYALIKLGCRMIFICNRTKAKADEVAAHFNRYARDRGLLGRQNENGQVCRVIESPSEDWPEGYQQPTMIVSCIPASGTDDNPPVDFRMPSQWLQSPTGGVVIEVRNQIQLLCLNYFHLIHHLL